MAVKPVADSRVISDLADPSGFTLAFDVRFAPVEKDGSLRLRSIGKFQRLQ